MKIVEMTFHLITLVAIVIGFIHYYFRILYLQKKGQFNRKAILPLIFIGFFPIPENKLDNEEQKKLVKKTNSFLRVFYILFLVLLIMWIVNGILFLNWKKTGQTCLPGFVLNNVC